MIKQDLSIFNISYPVTREPASTPPASPGATRRARDDDVFLRLAGAGHDNSPQGIVKELAIKRVIGGNTRAWLQCTHVAEGHAGAALALAATTHAVYSGGVDRTVRGWDLSVGSEAWRGWCGGAVSSLAAGTAADGGRLLLAAAGPAVRLFDTRTRTPLTTLWSSGATGPCPAGRGASGEVPVTALRLCAPHTLYTAAGDKLRLWDLRMLECVYKIWSGHAAAVMCLAAADNLLVTGSKDHYVRAMEINAQDSGGWETSSRRLLEPPHYDGVQALALRGHVLYSASRDTSLKRWNLHDNSLTHSVMNAHKGWVTGVCVLGGAEEGAVASCGREGAVRVWSADLRAVTSPAALSDAVHALDAHPDPHRRTLYTASNGGEVRAWRIVVEP